MLTAPATAPAIPARRTIDESAPLAANPRISDTFDTSPSLTPNTAARARPPATERWARWGSRTGIAVQRTGRRPTGASGTVRAAPRAPTTSSGQGGPCGHAGPSRGRPRPSAVSCELALARQPDDPVLPRFLAEYYCELPEVDVDDRKLDDIYAVAVAHLDLGSGAGAGRAGRARRVARARARRLAVRRTRCSSSSPTTCRSSSTRCGWCSTATASTSTCSSTRCSPSSATTRTRCSTCARRRHGLTERARRAPSSRRGPRSRSTASTTRSAARLEREIAAAIADVRRVVADFGAMRARLDGVAGADPLLTGSPTATSCSSAPSTTTAAPTARVDAARRVRSSACRATTRGAVRPRPMPGDGPVVIARTDDVVARLPGPSARPSSPCARRAGRRLRAPLRRPAGDERLPRQRARHPRLRRRGRRPRSR